MASENFCAVCIRSLRYAHTLKHQRRIVSNQSPKSLAVPTRRLLNTSPRYLAQATSVPNSSPEPPPAPTSSDGPSTAAMQEQIRESIPSSSFKSRIESGLKKTSIAQTYAAYGSAEMLYKICAAQADYSIPQALEKDGVVPKSKDGEDLGVELGLTPTFNTWAQVTMLYMYLILVRMRYFPTDQFTNYNQHFVNHFFQDAEDRMAKYHGMVAAGVRQKHLKDLFTQWRGALTAYDEGLIRGDAVLATAVWRNIFKANIEVDVEKVAAVAGYMRRCLRMLDTINNTQIERAKIDFPGLEKDELLVKAESPRLKAPFTEAAST
ncbi:MAG: Protein cbp3, mitochondrial [Bogoriella megaspora]|nr:MAG: Protein cbp3, mitochondrial [Bogoriella megaspora]